MSGVSEIFNKIENDAKVRRYIGTNLRREPTEEVALRVEIVPDSLLPNKIKLVLSLEGNDENLIFLYRTLPGFFIFYTHKIIFKIQAFYRISFY